MEKELKSNLQYDINDTLMHYISRNINCVAIRSQVCFHRWLFADRVKPHWCITGPVGPLGCTNQSWCGVKLLTIPVSTHPVGCVHICHLLRGQHHSMHPNGSFCPPPACHPQGRILYVKLFCVFHVLILQYYYSFKYNIWFCLDTPPIFPEFCSLLS